MLYDAFISYRHGELDGVVAERLHKMLETYRIPNSIAKKLGRKQLGRVFRDREELPTSANLSDSINEALENSEFLLLICSKRTRESRWVMRELEQFGELRGKDKIITLLIDGEPSESFPPNLWERDIDGEVHLVEPLAADIRADSWAKSLTLLKEEKLRLLATILGCSFDDLRRRHQRRKIQQTGLIVGAIFAITLAFGTLTTTQYLQINRQMQLKLENQSYVLAEYSDAKLADGDRDLAVLLALEALPDGGIMSSRPFVPVAQRALADALGVYDVTSGYKPHKAVTLPAAPLKIALSPSGKFAAALYPFEVTVFDTETGRKSVNLPSVHSILSDAEFLSDSVIVFTGGTGVNAYNISTGEPVWIGEAATLIAVSEDKTRIAAVYRDCGKAIMYSAEGQMLSEIDFGGKVMAVTQDNNYLNSDNTLFELNNSGEYLAVSFSDGSVDLIDTKTGAATEIFVSPEAKRFSGAFYNNTFALSVVENEPYAAFLCVYNLNNFELTASYRSDEAQFIVKAYGGGLFLAHGEQLMTIDPESGEVSHSASAGGYIETFAEDNGQFIITEKNGSYRFSGADNGAYQSDYTCHFAAVSGGVAITASRDSKVVRILKKTEGSGEPLLSYDADYRFSEVKINTNLGRVAYYSYTGLRLGDLNGNIIAETTFPDPLSVLDTQYDSTSGNVAVIYADALRLYGGADGLPLLEKQFKSGGKSVYYTPFGVGTLSENGEAALYDLETAEVIATANAEADAKTALPIPGGGLITVQNDRVLFDTLDIGAGTLIGAAKTDDSTYAFAFSDGSTGYLYKVKNGTLSKLFEFRTHGNAEVYFTGGYIFISHEFGGADVYSLSGKYIRSLDEDGYMTDADTFGENIVINYISSSGGRYSLLLEPKHLETLAAIPGLCGKDNGRLILNGGGTLRAVDFVNTNGLAQLAKERLDGRELTPDEIVKYNAG